MVVNVALSAYYAPGIALSIVRIQEQCGEPFIQLLYRTQKKKKQKTAPVQDKVLSIIREWQIKVLWGFKEQEVPEISLEEMKGNGVPGK